MPDASSNPLRRQQWLGAAVVLLGMLGFLALWWNRFIGLSSNGWFYFYGQQILAGKVPYRDFYLYLPPLHALKFAALQSLFGNLLLPARMLAVAERAGLALLLYRWLLRCVTPSAAAFGALVTGIVFCGDMADALSLHHHESIFWACIASLSASTWMRRPHRAWAIASGVAAALCLLTKQTTGLGITVVIPVVLLYLHRRACAVRFLPLYAAGWLLPTGLTATWLSAHGAFGPFLDQVFLSGPSSKGPLGSVLLRPILMTFANGGYLVSAVTAALLLAQLAWILRKRNPASQTPFQWTTRGAYSLIFLPPFLGVSHVLARTTDTIAIYAALLGSAALTVHYARRRNPDLLLISAVSATTAFLLSLSWSAYEPMVAPGLAIILALALHRAGGVLRIGVLTAGFALAAFSAADKLALPFHWEGWEEPAVSYATVPSALPELRGFQLAPETNHFLERVTHAIEQNSAPGEPIFVFPYAPLFYTLSHRPPSTFAYVHWFDVTPDRVARRDAATLLREPPRVIVMFEFTPDELRKQEALFRGGSSAGSGQRDLVAALQSLITSYRLVDSVSVPHSGHAVHIYAR